MSDSNPYKPVPDEELIGVLMSISVVSKRLARKLIQLNQTSQSKEGGTHEQNGRDRDEHRRATGYCIFYGRPLPPICTNTNIRRIDRIVTSTCTTTGIPP